MQLVDLILKVVLSIGMVLFGIIYAIVGTKKANKKIKEYKERTENQIDDYYDELLPVYQYCMINGKKDSREARYNTKMVLSIIVVFVVSVIIILLAYYNNLPLIFYFVPLIPFLLVMFFWLIRNERKRTNKSFLEAFKKKIDKKYTFISEHTSISSEKSNYYHKIFPFIMIRGMISRAISGEFLTVTKDGFQLDMGRDVLISYDSKEGTPFHTIFAEITVPFSFEHKIMISNIDDIYQDDESSIVPKYKSIPLITFERGNKEYASKLINEEIQKLISKISSKTRDFNMYLHENKIFVCAGYHPWSYLASPSDEYQEAIIISLQELSDFLVEFADELNK